MNACHATITPTEVSGLPVCRACALKQEEAYTDGMQLLTQHMEAGPDRPPWATHFVAISCLSQ